MKILGWTCFALAGLLGVLAILIVMGGCALNRADGNGGGTYPFDLRGFYPPPRDWTPPAPYTRGVVIKEMVGLEGVDRQRNVILVDMDDGRERLLVFDKATKKLLGWRPAVRIE